ncbi:hypothetical protein [Okeania sp. SIO2B3]|uniref:hypothetical protein n=1 Tax=Okeania sp. SIO2B3 TaxID=2607784 RepID=UPI0013C26C0E|nr:hypothetical protein [Okeania sp. SIO2B3]NET41210.1 hypothetical protein [Okeania sp. SIO2B3]
MLPPQVFDGGDFPGWHENDKTITEEERIAQENKATVETVFFLVGLGLALTPGVGTKAIEYKLMEFCVKQSAKTICSSPVLGWIIGWGFDSFSPTPQHSGSSGTLSSPD